MTGFGYSSETIDGHFIFNVLVVVEKEIWKDGVNVMAVSCDRDSVPVGEVHIAFLLKTRN